MWGNRLENTLLAIVSLSAAVNSWSYFRFLLFDHMEIGSLKECLHGKSLSYSQLQIHTSITFTDQQTYFGRPP